MPSKKNTTKVTKENAPVNQPPKKTPSKKAAAKPRVSKGAPVKVPQPGNTRPSQMPKTAAGSGKVQQSSAFAKAESKAQEYMKNPKKLGKLFEDAARKAKVVPKGPFGETWAYLQAMIRLVRAYANGAYREVPVGSLLMILVAVIYFVSPVDLIPDFIPVGGLIDDALVVGLALKQVKSDLDAFMAWEMEATTTQG